MMMESYSDPNVVFNWAVYSEVAQAYARSALFDKAYATLKKSEGLLREEPDREVYEGVMSKYAA